MAYIDKKTAIEKVIEALNPSAIKAIQAKTAIEKIPNADVAEVVRCKDCKYFMEYTDEYKVESADGDCYLRVVNSTSPQFNAVKYDEFCSYGKRYST